MNSVSTFCRRQMKLMYPWLVSRGPAGRAGSSLTVLSPPSAAGSAATSVATAASALAPELGAAEPVAAPEAVLAGARDNDPVADPPGLAGAPLQATAAAEIQNKVKGVRPSMPHP